jgi:hypothetical protein
MTTSTLYFLRRESDGAVKIGVTTNLRQCIADSRRSHGALTFRSAWLGVDAPQPALLDRREWAAPSRGMMRGCEPRARRGPTTACIRCRCR